MGLYGLSMYPDGYNIYAGGGSPENRTAFEKSLDKFIAANPKVGNIDTEMFRDFMIALADHESSFRSKATNNVGSYSGYYGLLNGSKMTEEEQHRAAYNHLKKIFTENMVKEDIVKASELGITPAQLLIKYWNQGNRVTNYLYNGKDSTDGLGTKVSEYGNDINLDLDYSAYLPSAITSDFVTVEKGKNSLSNAIKLARIPGMDYSNRESYITNLNKEYNKGFDSRKLQVGDMIWLVPKNDSEKQDTGNAPTRSNQMHFLEAPQGEYQVSPYNMPAFKTPYVPAQSIDLNTKEGFDNPILQYRVNTKATGGPLTKYDTKLPKEKEQAYAQWVESLPLNLRDDHDYDLRGAFLEGLKPDKYGHMSDKYKKPWHQTFSNESIYSTKDMQGGHWEGDEFVPSPWQERRQQLINSMNLMEPNTFSNGGTIHIKPENKGKFTAAAKRAGKSVQGYASQILANPDNYSSTLVKRANFARNAAKWHACGGKLYPDGGPIDPPWASFVPSQPREPQVVKPQPQANPYLLGLSAGMGRNEAAKYSTAAQTPEFQQGYYDGQAQVVASEAAKAGRAPVVEPGIEVVSPVLSVLPGTGDVKDFADIADYYYNTGDLATSLGLAALTVASPVQGVGKLGKLSNEARALKMLQDAEYNIKHYAERIAEKPKPLGSIDYKIPEGEKVPELNPISKRLEIPYAPEGHSKFKKEAGEQFDKALKEQPKKIKGKDSKKSAGATAQERVAQIETDPSDMTRWQKAKAWAFKPWKEQSKLRKGVEGTIGTALGLSAVGYGIKKGFDIAENAKKSVDYNFNPASARPDSVTAARYYEDFIKDSLDNEANRDIYLDLGYPKELVDSVKNDNLKKLFEKYQEHLPYKTQ